MHVTFAFVVSAVMPGVAGGARGMAVCGAIVFVSLLAHEFAHAAAGLAWGSRATVVLHPFVGRTHMDPPLPLRRAIVANLMGPLVSLILGLSLAALRARIGSAQWLDVAMWVNLAAGALNLLPILPFDAGIIVLGLVGPRRAYIALMASVALSVDIAIVGLAVFRSAAVTLIFGAAAAASAFEWVNRRREDKELRLGVPAQIEAARRMLADDRHLDALSSAKAAARNAQSDATERKALELVAWSLLGLGQPMRAKQALSLVRPARSVDVYCWAAVEDACGRADHAIVALEAARAAGTLPADAVKLLIDLHARRDDLDNACRVARTEIDALGAADARRVLEVAFERKGSRAAIDLAGRLFDVTSSVYDGVAYAHGLVELGRENDAVAVLARVADATEELEARPSTLRRLAELSARYEAAGSIQDLLARIALRTTRVISRSPR